MSNQNAFTTVFFTRRLADLCLRSGLSGLPSDGLSRHVLFTSMVTGLPADRPIDQPAVDAQLAGWIATSGLDGLDHVTLRRCLVDAGYLSRPADGSEYRVVADPPGRPPCDPAVGAVDLGSVLQARREEVARRKAEYLARAGR